MATTGKFRVRSGHTMTDSTYEQHEIAARISHFLKECAYPGPHKRKRLARDFAISESLAKLWLGGQLPAAKHLTKMPLKWGGQFIAYVYAPFGSWARELGTADRLNKVAAEAEAIRREIEDLRKAS